MGYRDNFPRVSESIVAAFGVPVDYSADGAASVSIVAVFRSGENLDDAKWQTSVQASGTLRVLKTDVPAWTIQDVVTIDGVAWTVVRQISETPGDRLLEIRSDLRPQFGSR